MTTHLFIYDPIRLEDSRIILDSLREYLLSPRRAEEHNRMTNGVTAGASSLRKPLARFITPRCGYGTLAQARAHVDGADTLILKIPLFPCADRSKLFSRKLQCPPRLAYHVPTSPMNYDSRDEFPPCLCLCKLARAMPSKDCNCNCILDERTWSLAYLCCTIFRPHCVRSVRIKISVFTFL